MLITISPAKTLDFESPLATTQFTQPELLKYSQQLIAECRKLSSSDIASLMKISDKLAGLNAARFGEWQPDFTPDNARQAILAFKGDVYTGMQAAELFTDDDFQFAQQHLRILSGLYGVLRPLDLMQPYRLEMGIKLNNKKGSDLYQFWGNTITETLNNALEAQGDNILVNLASDEYFKSYKVISFYAKKARGLMSRFIIQERLSDKAQLKEFNLEGYQFNAAESEGNTLVFKRAEHLAK